MLLDDLTYECFDYYPLDLTFGSGKNILYKCDYCGKIKTRRYCDYISRKSHHDSCDKCKGKKIEDSNIINYGVKNVSQLEEVKNKRLETFINKYGVDHPSKTQEVQDKITKTNLERYGNKSARQSEKIKEQAEQTNLNKYGAKNPFASEEIKEKIKKTNLERYGVENPICSPLIMQKAINTLIKNKNEKSSKQQIAVYNILLDSNLNPIFNYPYSHILCDIYLEIDNVKINIEYDGEYWHKQRKIQDRKRDEFLKSNGFKILRIKSYSLIPTKEQLLESINYLLSSDKKYAQIILKDCYKDYNILESDVI